MCVEANANVCATCAPCARCPWHRLQTDGPTIDDPVEILGVALAVRGIRVDQLFKMWGASSGETLSHEDFVDLLAR